MGPAGRCIIFCILCGSSVVGIEDFPGIAVEVTNAALRFLSSVVKEAIPKVLHNIQLVEQKGLGWQASNLMVILVMQILFPKANLILGQKRNFTGCEKSLYFTQRSSS